MKDILFFPLVFAVIAGIIVFALDLGGGRVSLTSDDIVANGYGLSGAELVDLTASPGTEIRVTEDGARAVMVQARADAVPSAGVFLTIPPVAEAAFAGRPLAITWRMRSDSLTGGGFMTVELGYFTLGAGDTGWQRYDIDEGFQDIVQTFTPGPNDGEGFDYAGLWPGIGAPDGTAVVIESVRVQIAD